MRNPDFRSFAPSVYPGYYHMTHKEGVSYDRVVGYRSTKEPTRQDKDTVDRVINKVGDGILTYCNGAEIQVDLRRDNDND